MNGTTMFRPAGRVSLYLPNRSTIPARACGMIRTVFASRMITNSSRIAARIRTTVTDVSSSFAELADGVDVRRRATDLEDLHGAARLDGDVLVVRRGRPGVPGQV